MAAKEPRIRAVDRERVLAQLGQVVVWSCGDCQQENETALFVWPVVRFSVLCAACDAAQDYLGHLMDYDPDPPPSAVARRRLNEFPSRP